MNSGYIPMGAGHVGRLATSAPIPIRQPKEPGYMEMGPSSQPLPQIKEGGSKHLSKFSPALNLEMKLISLIH